MNYIVFVNYSASKVVEIEANSPEEAAQLAYDEAGNASLCHQCAREIDVGDAYRATVFDENQNEELYDDGKEKS